MFAMYTVDVTELFLLSECSPVVPESIWKFIGYILLGDAA